MTGIRILVCAALAALVAVYAVSDVNAEADDMIVFRTEYMELAVAKDGKIARLADRKSGKDLIDQEKSFVAAVEHRGEWKFPTAVKSDNGLVVVSFSGTDAKAALEVREEKRYLTFELKSLEGEGVDKVCFPHIFLKKDEAFAGCALALNLRTNVHELPQANTALKALAYSLLGFEGAKVAILGCPTEQLRYVMQEVVTNSPDLPKSPIGGPWALDGEDNRGSYLFNFDGVTAENAELWIALARSLGINQIDFHGGQSFRFGDFRPNPSIYPNGKADLKAAVDKLHEAGIKAGFHTYANFIAKDSVYVTPVPHPGLGKDAVFTLAEDLPAEASVVPVVQSTEEMSTVTGFFVWNSVTIQVGDELIIYSGVQKEPPFAFTGCSRGAHGTKVSAHPKGAPVYHLKECFGLFTPDGESDLMREMAQKTAETFNECGFDMIYLDALDGAGIMGPRGFDWHYSSKFVFEIWKHLERPALQEMSTFSHHLWFVRSRMGAWDHPNRSHKKFIDVHVKSNENNARMFLPGHLGWWALKPAAAFDTERTYWDDIEYLCAKSAGTDCGLSIMGVHPNTIGGNAALLDLAKVIKRWEDLRQAGFFTEEMKEQLRRPGKDFTLRLDEDGKPQLHPGTYIKHKYEQYDQGTHSWKVENPHAEQTPGIRIEALWSVDDFDSPEGSVLVDFMDEDVLPVRESSEGIRGSLTVTTDDAGKTKGVFTAARPTGAANQTAEAQFSPTEHGVRIMPDSLGWTKWERKWDSPIDLGEKKAIGVWIEGDGQGEVLNFQVRSPHSLSHGINDHYVTVDFTGPRYFALVEPEGERTDDYPWPYARNVYGLYRELVRYGQVETFGIWMADIPAGRDAKCVVGPVKALPIRGNVINNASITINGKTLTFPAEIQSGGYLEFRSVDDCKLYDPNGAFIQEVRPNGEIPSMREGANEIAFDCSGDHSSRARVTIMTFGDAVEQGSAH